MSYAPNIPTPRRIGALTVVPALLVLAVSLLTFEVATQWVAQRLGYQPRLGQPTLSVGSLSLYPPWRVFQWQYWFSSYAPNVFSRAFTMCLIGPLVGTALVVGYSVWASRKVRVATTHGSARWAYEAEYGDAGLLSGEGVVIGMHPDGRLLHDNGKEHVACIAPTRSGKGVGQVIPTLLTWPGSVLVHDMKGENWAITSAWRSTFSNVIYFNPTDPARSAHFNPLLEVRPDENQIRDVQNIADQLVDPHGKGKESHWDRTADQFFLGAILHVLHAEPDKSLYGLAKFLSNPDRDFEDTLRYMKAHPHDEGIAHERIAASAQAMLNKSEEERSGVLSTALGLLGLYSDPIVARNTADSDFRIVDLMQAVNPMSLYIVVPDSDRLRLKPLTRLMFTMITQRLVETLNPAENKHRLLLLIDEFPRLGRLPFFTDALSYMAGYNMKAMLVMQSKSQLDAPDSHGKGNTTIEGCKIRSLYTPQDPDTAQWISDALGPKTEVHQQTTYTGHRLAFWLGHIMVADQESGRPLLDAAEICKMGPSDQIILVAGMPPFRAKRLKYYERPDLAARAGLEAIALPATRPYPYRPKPHRNAWLALPCKAITTAAADSRELKRGAATMTFLRSVDPLAGEPVTLEQEGTLVEEQDLAAQAIATSQQLGLDELERLDRATSRARRPSISM